MASVPLNLVNAELRKIAKDISVQVLTHQPENIYKFTADYLAKKLDMRDKKDIEIFVHDLIENDLTYEAMLKRRGVSLEAANKASSVMQGAVRRFLLKQKARSEHEKIEISMDAETTVSNLSIDGIESTAVMVQKETPPGDAELLKPSRASSSSLSPRLLSINSGIEGDIIRADGPGSLGAVQNMGSLDEEDETMYSDEALLTLEMDPSQESDLNATKDFAESMLMDILSGIFENDALLYGQSFDKEMEHLTLGEEGEIVTQN